jgi:hypothetical protein
MVTRHAVVRHAALTIGVVLVVGALLSFVFRGPGDVRAIWISGVVAVVVQLAAFSLSRIAGAANLMARMGAGMLIRFLALVAYALLVAFVLRIPTAAALVSLAAFFFLSTLIEPLLIKS